MTNTKDIILQLKQVKEEKNLSLGRIYELIQNNGDSVSKSTLSRVFSEGSEDVSYSFKYEDTIRPIAKAVLDMENIEDTDDMDIKALKTLLKYKIARIEELESQLDKEKLKYHDKIDKEREQFHKSLNFLKDQVALKDKRIDQLLDANVKLLDQLLTCPCRNEKEG